MCEDVGLLVGELGTYLNLVTEMPFPKLGLLILWNCEETPTFSYFPVLSRPTKL